jgi:hypothetical protein
VIGFYNKKKAKFLDKIRKWAARELATDYPFLWRRNWIEQLAAHIDLFFITIIVITGFFISNSVYGTNNYSVGSLIAIATVPVGFTLYILAALVSSKTDFNPKLPYTGYYDFKEELMVAIINMVSKSYILLYPLFIFAVIQSSSRPTFLKSFNEDIAGYLTLYANQDFVKAETDFTLSQRKALVDQHLNLNPNDKAEIYQKLEHYDQQVTSNDIKVTDSLLVEMIYGIQNKYLKEFSMQEVSWKPAPTEILYLMNASINMKIQLETYTKSIFHKVIVGLYFLLCIVTYLEREYSFNFLNEYGTYWIEFFTKYIGLPIIILGLPFVIGLFGLYLGLVEEEVFENFSENLYNTYYSPPLKIISNILSIIGNLIIQYMTPIFLALSLFFVFFKKRLIELSLEPE